MATLNISRTSIWKTSINYGLLGFAAFAIIFFIFRVLGVAEHTELRFLNFILVGIVSFLAVRHYQLETHNQMNYLEGLAVSFLTTVISFSVFGLALWGYLGLFDPQLLSQIAANSPHGMYPSHFHSGVMMVSEGVGGGVIIALIVMQYFKRNRMS